MSCRDRIECERLKDIKYASVLASQIANLTNTKLAVVKLKHPLYGEYYKGIPYNEAQRMKLRIYDYFERGKSMKKKTSAKSRKNSK